MRILYLTPDLTNSGGIARVLSLKVNYLISTQDYEVTVLTDNSSNADFFYDFNSKINWVKIDRSKKGVLFLWDYFRLINATIAQCKPDIIVVCDAYAWFFLPWVLKTKTPIIFETHVSIHLKKIINTDFFNKIRFGLVHFYKKMAAKKMAAFVVETNEGTKEWKLENVKIIPNPLSFIPEEKAILLNEKVIAICRHSHEKGIDRLLLIWKQIIIKHPDWVLDIYGEWNTDLFYQKMAKDLRISKNVNFIAPVNPIQEKFNQASILLMTSRSEAFGMVLIEAMASGLPCVAYDCPIGPRTIIENDINGFLIENGNTESFVEKLIILIENRSLRKKIGANGIISVEKYHIDMVMKMWIKLFENTVKNNKNSCQSVM